MKYRLSGSGLLNDQHGGERKDAGHGQDDCQVEVQRTTLGAAGDPDGGVIQRPDGVLVGPVRVDPGRHPVLRPRHEGAAEVHRQAQGKRQRRQAQGRGEAVPQRKVAGLLGRCSGVGRGGGEQRGVRLDPFIHGCRPQPVHDGEEAEEGGGGEEGRPDRLERGPLNSGLGGEGAPHKAGAVCERQDGAQDDAREHQHAPRTALRVVDEGFEHRFLGHEPCQQRDAGHGRGADAGDDSQGAGRREHAGQLPDVAGPGLVVDDAHHQEQRCLEQAVRQEHRESGERGVRRAQAHHHGEEAELADGAVGEDQLDVGLAERPVPAHQHGGQPEPQHNGLPVRGLGEARRQPCHQVDAGLHHRSGVQVGADRGGCRHGPGEPEVEGDQRGFGDGAHQDEDDGGGHRCAGGSGYQLGSLCQDRRDPVRSGAVAEHDEAHQHGQSAGGGDHQRLQRGAAGREAGAGEADQQVGQDGGEFPEDEQQEKVVRHHQAEHGPGERQELRAEAAEVLVLFLEIPCTVDQHERADAQHQERHHPGKGIQPEGELQLEPRNPGEHLADKAGVRIDRSVLQDQPEE